jgi:hypothetical protein
MQDFMASVAESASNIAGWGLGAMDVLAAGVLVALRAEGFGWVTEEVGQLLQQQVVLLRRVQGFMDSVRERAVREMKEVILEAWDVLVDLEQKKARQRLQKEGLEHEGTTGEGLRQAECDDRGREDRGREDMKEEVEEQQQQEQHQQEQQQNVLQPQEEQEQQQQQDEQQQEQHRHHHQQQQQQQQRGQEKERKAGKSTGWERVEEYWLGAGAGNDGMDLDGEVEVGESQVKMEGQSMELGGLGGDAAGGADLQPNHQQQQEQQEEREDGSPQQKQQQQQHDSNEVDQQVVLSLEQNEEGVDQQQPEQHGVQGKAGKDQKQQQQLRAAAVAEAGASRRVGAGSSSRSEQQQQQQGRDSLGLPSWPQLLQLFDSIAGKNELMTEWVRQQQQRAQGMDHHQQHQQQQQLPGQVPHIRAVSVSAVEVVKTILEFEGKQDELQTVLTRLHPLMVALDAADVAKHLQPRRWEQWFVCKRLLWHVVGVEAEVLAATAVTGRMLLMLGVNPEGLGLLQESAGIQQGQLCSLAVKLEQVLAAKAEMADVVFKMMDGVNREQVLAAEAELAEGNKMAGDVRRLEAYLAAGIGQQTAHIAAPVLYKGASGFGKGGDVEVEELEGNEDPFDVGAIFGWEADLDADVLGQEEMADLMDILQH